MFRFLASESGALTTDWVVLAASVVGMGVATVGTMRGGMNALATDVETSLSSTIILYTELQQQYPGLYVAWMQWSEFFPEGDPNSDGGVAFESLMNHLTTADDSQLLQWTIDGVSTSAYYLTRRDLLDTMIGQNLSEAEAMAMLGIPATNRRGTPNRLLPDVETYLRNNRAAASVQVEQQIVLEALATQRGLTW